MKKKIKIILIALVIAILVELAVIIAFQARKIINETLNLNTNEVTKQADKNKDKAEVKAKSPSSVSTEIPSVLPEKPEFEAVDPSYFDDALFLGDSRTVGLRAFGSFTNSAYFAKTGISVNSFFMYPALDEETGLTLTQTLSQKQFKKIYIMIGVNDAGMVPLEDFETQFFDAINEIRLLQPDAVIYIQSILGVTKNKELSDPYHYNNERILERNALLKSKCDGEKLVYLDVFSAFTDKEGYLNQFNSSDGLHLNSSDYDIWCDYLLRHALPVE